MAESVVGTPLSILPVASTLTLLVNYFAIKAGFYRSLSAVIYPASPSFKDVLFIFFSYFFFHLIFFPLSIYLALSLYNNTWITSSTLISSNTQLWINCLSLWMLFPFLILLCKLFNPTAYRSVIRSDTVSTIYQWVHNLFFGAVTWIISYPLVFTLNIFSSKLVEVYFHPPETDQVAVKILKMTFGNPLQLIFFLMAIVLIVPLVEEFLFRGILQRWLSVKIGPWPAIISASVAFSALHYSTSQGIYNLELLPALFLLSCYLGFLYERQRSLWAPIGLHTTFNLISSIVLIYQGA